MGGEPGTTTPSSWPWNGRPSLSFPRDSRPSLSRSTCSSFPRNIRSSFPRRRESSHLRDPTHHSTANQLDSCLRGNDEQKHPPRTDSSPCTPACASPSRSEERRVGEESDSTSRSRWTWSPYKKKKN